MAAWAIAAAVLSASLLSSCDGTAPPLPQLHNEHPHVQRPGDLVSIAPLSHFSLWGTRLRLWLAGISKHIQPNELRYGVDCYRIHYWSVDPHGKPREVSGLLALPTEAPPTAIISYQHGTTTTRGDGPSQLNLDGELVARLFAGQGYAVIAADYQGLGDDRGQHPYLIATTAANDVTLLLRSVEPQLGHALPVFLLGFSQGGHATLAALRALEESKYGPIGGAIAIAGPHNLRTISVPNAMKGASTSSALYLAYLTLAYADAYDQPLATVLRDDQMSTVQRILDGTHEPQEIIAALPKNPRDLYRPEYLAALDQHAHHWLLDAMRSNEVSHWTPHTPVLLLYGEKDVDVPPQDAIETAAEMSARGAAVQARSLGPVDHEGSIEPAVPIILKWLRERRQ